MHENYVTERDKSLNSRIQFRKALRPQAGIRNVHKQQLQALQVGERDSYRAKVPIDIVLARSKQKRAPGSDMEEEDC